MFLVGIASAFTINPNVTSVSFSEVGQSQTISVLADTNVNFSTSNPAHFSVQNLSSTTNTGSVDYKITLDDVFGVGTESLTINAINSANASDTNSTSLSLSYSNTFCDFGSFVIDDDGNLKGLGDLDLQIDISNKGSGEDDEWFSLDTIEVEVTLSNDFDEDDGVDLDNTRFELGLYRDGENFADNLIWVSQNDEVSDDMDIDAEEDGTHTFVFRVDPELDDGEYILVIKAYNDEDGNQDNNHESFCIDRSDDLNEDYYISISIEQENDDDKMVIVDVDSLNLPIQVSCEDDSVTITTEVWNIGDKTFEDYVLVNLYNNELGIDLYQVIEDSKFRPGDSAEVTFQFDLPENVAEKQYTLHFFTYYDYDEDDGEKEDTDAYGETSDSFDAYLKIGGNCGVSDDVSVSAVLEDGGQAGKPLTVKATVTNEGDNPGVFTLNIANYASWAELSEVSQNTLTLDAGSSGEVLITLDVKSDASGEEVFNVEVLSNDKLVANQPVSVTIKEKTKIFNLINADNWQIWAIAALNVLLIVIIIIVAIRIARK
jgi:hypothetical protein